MDNEIGGIAFCCVCDLHTPSTPILTDYNRYVHVAFADCKGFDILLNDASLLEAQTFSLYIGSSIYA